jgi:hypothetical protein
MYHILTLYIYFYNNVNEILNIFFLMPYNNKYYTINIYLTLDRKHHNIQSAILINLDNLKIRFERGENALSL